MNFYWLVYLSRRLCRIINFLDRSPPIWSLAFKLPEKMALHVSIEPQPSVRSERYNEKLTANISLYVTGLSTTR
jgi:hypothetical protein